MLVRVWVWVCVWLQAAAVGVRRLMLRLLCRRLRTLVQAWGVLERQAGNAPLARELFKAALKVRRLRGP